ncbi:unnamed protein product [Bursaphelenchus okinawaensis]|uniref:Uncharacterized protein n=1 Tax=Bursaphelenchus okinawaensis TaxID=465554 RepID=A0A811LRN3_9BILA|nr:unnamed protein product [Bursaphelenchus okinawaensis]CAG9127696.1 unnamed protein product [Bursaphelenchus okinawaensis]
MTSVNQTRKTPAAQRPAEKRRRNQKETPAKFPRSLTATPQQKEEQEKEVVVEDQPKESESEKVDDEETADEVTDWFAENWKPNFRSTFPLIHSLERSKVLSEYLHLIQRYRARVDKVEASPKRLPNPQTQTVEELEKELEKCDAEIDLLNKKRENTNDHKKELMARYKALYREEDEERKRKEMMSQWDAFSTLLAGNPQALSQAQNLMLQPGLSGSENKGNPLAGLKNGSSLSTTQSLQGITGPLGALQANAMNNIAQTTAQSIVNAQTLASQASFLQSLTSQANLSSNLAGITSSMSGLPSSMNLGANIGMNLSSSVQNNMNLSSSVQNSMNLSSSVQNNMNSVQNSLGLPQDSLIGLNVTTSQHMPSQAASSSTSVPTQIKPEPSHLQDNKLGFSDVKGSIGLSDVKPSVGLNVAQNLSNQPSSSQKLNQNLQNQASIVQGLANANAFNRNLTPSTNDSQSNSPFVQKSYSPDAQRKKMSINPALNKFYSLLSTLDPKDGNADNLTANYLLQQQRQQQQTNSPLRRDYSSPVQQQVRQQQKPQLPQSSFATPAQTNPTLQALSQLQQNPLQYQNVRGFNPLTGLPNLQGLAPNTNLLQEFANLQRLQLAQQMQNQASAADILNAARNRNSPLQTSQMQPKVAQNIQAQRKASTSQFPTTQSSVASRIQQLQNSQAQQRSSTPQFAVPNLPGQPKMPPRPHSSTSKGNEVLG